jgi:hypothetical protein
MLQPGITTSLDLQHLYVNVSNLAKKELTAVLYLESKSFLLSGHTTEEALRMAMMVFGSNTDDMVEEKNSNCLDLTLGSGDFFCLCSGMPSIF